MTTEGEIVSVENYSTPCGCPRLVLLIFSEVLLSRCKTDWILYFSSFCTCLATAVQMNISNFSGLSDLASLPVKTALFPKLWMAWYKLQSNYCSRPSPGNLWACGVCHSGSSMQHLMTPAETFQRKTCRENRYPEIFSTGCPLDLEAACSLVRSLTSVFLFFPWGCFRCCT